MIEQAKIVISLRSDPANGHIGEVVLVTPNEEPRELSIRSGKGRIEVTLPRLTLWGIMSLQ